MSEGQSRLIIGFFIMVIFLAVWLLSSIGMNRNINYEMPPSGSCTKALLNGSLQALGSCFLTDKIYGHHYDVMYERYLREYRGKNLTFLEIGLGCGMPLGAGASAHMWRAYLGPQASIHIVEVDKPCATEWMAVKGSKVSRMRVVGISGKKFPLFFVNRLVPRLTNCVESTNRWARIHSGLDILSTSLGVFIVSN